ncbi:MAG TPA: hypothetical protein VFZ73_19490 [Gemmatimonadaceae bacterium]
MLGCNRGLNPGGRILLGRLLLLFILVPLIELVVLVQLGDVIGWRWAACRRRHVRRAAHPGGRAMLLTPGLLTDIAGLSVQAARAAAPGARCSRRRCVAPLKKHIGLMTAA